MDEKLAPPDWLHYARHRWNKAPSLRLMFDGFDSFSRWLLFSAGGLDNLKAFAQRHEHAAKERIELLRDPGAYLSGKVAEVGSIFDDGPAPTIWIYGPLVLQERTDLVSPLSVELALNAAAPRMKESGLLIVRVSSPGGSTTAGLLIAEMLRGLPAGVNIRIEIDRACYSAAALYLLPEANVVAMRSSATLMLHEPTWHFVGRASDVFREARNQRKRDESEWRAFAHSRRIDYAKVRRLALAERHLTARQALRLGLIDEIMPALPELEQGEY